MNSKRNCKRTIKKCWRGKSNKNQDTCSSEFDFRKKRKRITLKKQINKILMKILF